MLRQRVRNVIRAAQLIGLLVLFAQHRPAKGGDRLLSDDRGLLEGRDQSLHAKIGLLRCGNKKIRSLQRDGVLKQCVDVFTHRNVLLLSLFIGIVEGIKRSP